MITFILANDQKIDSLSLPSDNKSTWVGLYNYQIEEETMYFFGDKVYELRELCWIEVDLDSVPDTEFMIVKKIEIV